MASSIGVQRLRCVAALLQAPIAQGGLGQQILVQKAERFENGVLRALKGLSPEQTAHFKSLVDGVQDYGFEPLSGEQVEQHKANVRYSLVPLPEYPQAGDEEDEDRAVLDALGSVEYLRVAPPI